MSPIHIFFEGNSSLKLPLLRFIGKAVLASRGRIKIQLGKNKDETVKDFLRTIRENPAATIILLVDSDAPDDGKLLDRIKKASSWRKNPRAKIPAERIHWMVQMMESWFLADVAALKLYYGKALSPSALPKRHNVEEIPKDDVLKGLKRASRGQYDKGSHAPKILDRLSPDAVRTRAHNCDRFLQTVSNLVV